MRKDVWKLFVLLFGLNIAWIGILLKVFGLVPPPVLEIILDFFGLLSLIGAFSYFLIPFFQRLMAKRSNCIVILVNVLLAILLLSGASWYRIAHPPQVTLASRIQWKSLLGPVIPFCDSSFGNEWYALEAGTVPSCSATGLTLQQSKSTPLELALKEVQGRPYSANIYRVQVQLSFQKPNDTMTWASLLFPVTDSNGSINDYELALNATGSWLFRQAGDNSNLAEGSIKINLSIPLKIIVTVEESQVSCHVTDQYGNDLASASVEVLPTSQLEVSLGLIRLRVWQKNMASSSPVIFSHFELDAQTN